MSSGATSNLEQLEEPIRTISLICVSLGLRMSEALALKWSDVDCLMARFQSERGIVPQRVGNVNIAESGQDPNDSFGS